MDLAKVFDTVNHKIIIEKLEYVGGLPLQILTDYLKNRQQIIKINYMKSVVWIVGTGVLQGLSTFFKDSLFFNRPSTFYNLINDWDLFDNEPIGW